MSGRCGAGGEDGDGTPDGRGSARSRKCDEYVPDVQGSHLYEAYIDTDEYVYMAAIFVRCEYADRYAEEYARLAAAYERAYWNDGSKSGMSEADLDFAVSKAYDALVSHCPVVKDNMADGAPPPMVVRHLRWNPNGTVVVDTERPDDRSKTYYATDDEKRPEESVHNE